MTTKIGIIILLIGIFIPTVLYPLTEPIVYNRYSDLQLILKKGREGVTYGKGGYKREEYCIGRISVPYKYIIVGGIVLIFTGINILVFAVNKRK